jgi:class 3 adenylate cyclase/tetratricopeptide (TPR) repeat protein
MRCVQCQHESPAGVKFCGECGAPLGSRCRACGTTNPPSNKFCQDCGAALAERASASPEAYTPEHLATKILTSRSTLDDERKQVTVMFADLKGSMELLANRDPEEARKLLDPILERMMDAVHRYEGTVNQVMGDGIMALFGAPIAHEDHALRAGYAALKMQESIRAYADELAQRHGAVVEIRVGLNSGEVVVRGISSDLRMDYSAVGQTTHLAARMEQLAAPGSIFVTDAFARLAEGYLHFKPLGLVSIKGLGEPMDVFQLVDAEPTRARFQAAARGLTRFVGRQDELAELGRGLDRAARGAGQVLAIIGEPGVGKSRLVYELVDSAATQGWLTLETGSVSYGRSQSYQPLRELLKTYFRIEDQDEADTIRAAVSARVAALDPRLEPTTPALLALLGAPIDDPAWRALDPAQRAQRMLEAAKRLLVAESLAQPVLLIFENLHWIDAETQSFLDGLVETIPTARIMLLVNYRPEYRHGWASKSGYTQLRLDPLSRESAEHLLQALLGDGPDLAPLKALLIERTEGNPFFLEESVRTLWETKVLVGARGASRLGRPLASIQVPATVQTILAARIDRLPVHEKRLLQCAAVIGRELSFPLLRDVAELPESELATCLAHLQAGEFVYETSLFPELEYTFRHALTLEVAYGSLLQDRRRALHARIVTAIERLEGDRLARHVDRLAHHALRGEVWDKALDYTRRAGAQAMEGSAYTAAVGWLEQALAAIDHLPPRRQVQEQAVDIRLDLRNSLLPLGEHHRIIERLREGERLAAELSDDRRLGWVLANLAREFVLLGDPGPAVEAATRALSLAEGHADFALQVTSTSVLGQAHYAEGAYAVGAAALRRIVRALDQGHGRQRLGLAGLPSVTARTFLAFCLAELGEFDEAELRTDEAIRLAEAVDHPYSLAHALFGAGHVWLRRGKVRNAIAVLERGLRLCEERGIRFAVTRTASSLGHAYTLAGRVSAGLPLLERAVGETEAMGVGYSHALWLIWLAEGHLAAGHVDEAERQAERALAVAAAHSERGHAAWAARLRAELHAGRGRVAEARAAYEGAIGRAAELGMRPLHAHCNWSLGVLERDAQRPDEAKRRMQASLQEFRALGAPFWAARVEDSLARA